MPCPPPDRQANPTAWPTYVLAGGRSSRYGSNKARAPWGDGTLLQRAVAPFAGTSIVVVGRFSGEYEDLGLGTIGDLAPDLGPLGGLVTALDDATRRCPAAPGVLLIPCDTLDVESASLAPLRSAVLRGASAAAFRHDRWEPFFAVYALRALAPARAALAGTDHSLRRFLDAIGAQAFPPPPGWHDRRRMDTPPPPA